MIIAFIQQSLPLPLKVLLGNFGFLFFNSLLPFEMLLGNVWVLSKPSFIVILSIFDLVFNELLAAPP